MTPRRVVRGRADEPKVASRDPDVERDEDEDEVVPEGAPATESPESPAAPPESAREARVSAPLAPVEPERDYGVGSPPAERPDVFSASGYDADADYGVATEPRATEPNSP